MTYVRNVIAMFPLLINKLELFPVVISVMFDSCVRLLQNIEHKSSQVGDHIILLYMSYISDSAFMWLCVLLTDKCSHVCLGSSCVSGHVADPCDCSCFYHCVKAGDQWTAIQQCCNLCEVWDDYVWTCVRDYNDPNCTFSPTTETTGELYCCYKLDVFYWPFN